MEMDEQKQKIEALKAYFTQRDDVIMAFLFGSRAKGHARTSSDWDVGVYMSGESREDEQQIWTDVERMLNANVDLVILNRAPATIAWTALRSGIVLAIKDRQRYLNVMFRVSDEANAWYETSRNYYRIFERSRSLIPEDQDRLRRILSYLEKAVMEYPMFRGLHEEEYLQNIVQKRNVEHWIEHMVVSAVDIAEIILASERRPLPTIYRELLVALGSVDPFTKDDTPRKIAEWAHLRNMLAHEYLDYQWSQITSFISDTEQLFQTLIERTKEFVNRA